MDLGKFYKILNVYALSSIYANLSFHPPLMTPSVSLQNACLWIATCKVDDAEIVSRCMLRVQQHWDYDIKCPDKVVRIHRCEVCCIVGWPSLTYCLDSRAILSGPVHLSTMVTAFTQDLRQTRDVAQYHCFDSGKGKDILDDVLLPFKHKIQKLIQFNRGFGLPIARPVLSEAKDSIRDIVYTYGKHILFRKMEEYTFFKDLRHIAGMPYMLKPMESHWDGGGPDGGDVSDEEETIGDSEDDEVYGVIEDRRTYRDDHGMFGTKPSGQ